MKERSIPPARFTDKEPVHAASGNLKASKKKSTARIDGIVAAIMALGKAMLRPERDDGPLIHVDDG